MMDNICTYVSYSLLVFNGMYTEYPMLKLCIKNTHVNFAATRNLDAFFFVNNPYFKPSHNDTIIYKGVVS